MDIIESFSDLQISQNHMQQLHATLLKYSSKDIRHKGEYKKLDNHVVAFDSNGQEIGIIFKTASPFETPLKMADLISWVNEAFKLKQTHPLLIIGVFIVVFLAIHPFQDGNGRLSRILTNLLLLKEGYNYIQYSSLESVIEQNKDHYYKNLRDCQKNLETNNIKFENWILFFLRSLKKQKDNLTRKIKSEKILQENLGQLHLQILEILKNHNSLSVSQIQKLSGANRNTLKIKLRQLVELKKVKKVGQGRGVVYHLITAIID